MTLLFGVPLSHSFSQSMVVVLPIKESYNLTDFERLFYLHYNYCYYYTDRFSTTLLFALLLQHWQIFNDSYCTISTTTATLKDFQRLLFALLLLLLQHSEIFNDSFICTIATTTATLRDFQRLFYLHYCCYYYCNTQRFSTTFICTIATTTKKTLKDFQRLLFALLLLLHSDRFWTTLICTTTTTTLIDFERLLFALLLLHW